MMQCHAWRCICHSQSQSQSASLRCQSQPEVKGASLVTACMHAHVAHAPEAFQSTALLAIYSSAECLSRACLQLFDCFYNLLLLCPRHTARMLLGHLYTCIPRWHTPLCACAHMHPQLPAELPGPVIGCMHARVLLHVCLPC